MLGTAVAVSGDFDGTSKAFDATTGIVIDARQGNDTATEAGAAYLY